MWDNNAHSVITMTQFSKIAINEIGFHFNETCDNVRNHWESQRLTLLSSPQVIPDTVNLPETLNGSYIETGADSIVLTMRFPFYQTCGESV